MSPPPPAESLSEETPTPNVLGTAELPASTELLAYYRSRIQDFEKERNEFIERTSSIEVSVFTVVVFVVVVYHTSCLLFFLFVVQTSC